MTTHHCDFCGCEMSHRMSSWKSFKSTGTSPFLLVELTVHTEAERVLVCCLCAAKAAKVLYDRLIKSIETKEQYV